MKNPRQNNSSTEHEYLADLKAKVDHMDESNFDEKIFHEYLDALGDAAKPETPIDVDASLARFRNKHAMLIERLDEKKKTQSIQLAKKARRRRWGYRLVVIAAAIIILNAMCMVAFGHSIFNYAAKWGEETFGFFHESDFETSEDGTIIYYPDGTAEDRGSMPDYDRTTYKQLPQSGSEIATTDPSNDLLPLPSQSPSTEFASIPDTDISALGLEKIYSEWNAAHTVENIRISNSNIIETAKAFGVTENLFPTWLPDGFYQSEVNVIKDYLNNTIDFSAYYSHSDKEYVLGVDAKVLSGGSGSTIIEKDDRRVTVYESNTVNWYIMSNLENVNATAIVGDRQILFSGPISIDEMKKMIDSVYEGD